MPARVYRRRRRTAALLAVTAVAPAVIGLELVLGDPIPVSLTAPAATIPSECTGQGRGELRRRLGMRLVVRMAADATPALRRRARRGEIGGVILFPPAGQPTEALASEIEKLQGAASRGGRPPLVVSVDQEGGPVKRLAELPPRRSPQALSEQGAAAARAEGRATGGALARLGVNVDLAPVLDVPAGRESFVFDRAFGTRPETVASVGVAFAAGLAEAGVVATAKHFPGLGRSAVNTDLAPSEIPAGRSQLSPDLLPFERAVQAGVGAVMLANASYPALDRGTPAFASERIAGRLLREQMGFGGVTITDDLGAGAVRASFGAAEAALAGAGAGADLLLFAQTPDPRVLDSLVASARRGDPSPAEQEESCARIVELRRSFESSRPG